MNATFDASKVVAAYHKAFKHMRQIPGFDHKLVLRAEIGSILKTWAGRTKVAKPEQAEWRARYRAGKRAFGDVGSINSNPYGISVNTGLRGGFPGEVWYRHPMSGKFQQAGVIDDSGGFRASWIHWKTPVWNKIHDGMKIYALHLRDQLQIAPKTIGFSRQSIIQIADALNIDLNQVKGQGVSAAGITKARAAIASSGRSYRNGYGNQEGTHERFFIRMTNRLPYGIKSGMDRTLKGVISGRAKFIQTAYAKGAFNSVRGVAKSFPNVFRSLNLSA